MNFLKWISSKFAKPRHGLKRAVSKRLVSLAWEGYAHLRAEDYEEAKTTFLQALQNRDELKRLGMLEYVLISLAATWLGMEAYDQGIAFFSNYIDSYSDDSVAYCCRAGELWYSGEFEEALRDYSRSIDLDPNNIIAMSGQGQVLAETGRNQEALAVLEVAFGKLQKADPAWLKSYKDIEAFIHRGRGAAAASLGQDALAMAEFDASIALCPENGWVYYSRAEMNYRLGRNEDALSDYTLALAKKGPALTPIQRGVVQTRIRGLKPSL